MDEKDVELNQAYAEISRLSDTVFRLQMALHAANQELESAQREINLTKVAK